MPTGVSHVANDLSGRWQEVGGTALIPRLHVGSSEWYRTVFSDSGLRVLDWQFEALLIGGDAAVLQTAISDAPNTYPGKFGAATLDAPSTSPGCPTRSSQDSLRVSESTGSPRRVLRLRE